MSEYPYLECDKHPGLREPGYVICIHIKTAADVAQFERATPQEAGSILCATCKEAPDNVTNLRTCCAACARENGLLIGA